MDDPPGARPSPTVPLDSGALAIRGFAFLFAMPLVLLAAALPLVLVTGFHFVNTRCSVLMIGAFRDTAEVGIYAAASRLAEMVGFGLVAVNLGSAPLISELHSQGRHRELQRMLRAAARVARTSVG